MEEKYIYTFIFFFIPILFFGNIYLYYKLLDIQNYCLVDNPNKFCVGFEEDNILRYDDSTYNATDSDYFLLLDKEGDMKMLDKENEILWGIDKNGNVYSNNLYVKKNSV